MCEFSFWYPFLTQDNKCYTTSEVNRSNIKTYSVNDFLQNSKLRVEGIYDSMNSIYQGNREPEPIGKTILRMFTPDITDVKPINDKVVIVSFADGTQEKVVLQDKDVFSVENGVSICIMKKIISSIRIGICKDMSTSGMYNQMIKYAMSKLDAEKKKKKAIAAKEKEEKRKKNIAHEKENRQKRDDREYQTRMYAEAFERALSNMNSTGRNCKKQED